MSGEILSADEATRLAAELLDRRRTGQARRVIAQALEVEPRHAGLLFQSARADWIEDDNASARQTLGHLLDSDPHDVDARLLLLALLTEDGELVQAEQLALGLLHEFPVWPGLYAAYSRVMLRALLIPKARALADEALRLAPDSDEALRAQALCDIADGRRGIDSQALQRLLMEHPEDQHTLALVVTSLVHDGQHVAALRGAQALLRAQPDNGQWLNLVRELSVQNHWAMRPLWPLQRWGWGASAGLWLGGIVATRLLGQVWPALAGPATAVVLGYAVYSWVAPSLIRRWVLRD